MKHLSESDLQINETKHMMRSVDDAVGGHYLVDGVTDVIDPTKSLVVFWRESETIVHPDLLRLQPDACGNMTIVLPLNGTTSLYIRNVLIIDDALIDVLNGTDLHPLVENRQDCLAVCGYEILLGDDSGGGQ